MKYKIVCQGTYEEIQRKKREIEEGGKTVVVPNQFEFDWDDYDEGDILWLANYFPQGHSCPIHYLVEKEK